MLCQIQLLMPWLPVFKTTKKNKNNKDIYLINYDKDDNVCVIKFHHQMVYQLKIECAIPFQLFLGFEYL